MHGLSCMRIKANLLRRTLRISTHTNLIRQAEAGKCAQARCWHGYACTTRASRSCCAHLSSGEGEADRLKRHSDFAEILRRAAFPADTDASGADPVTALAGRRAHLRGPVRGVHRVRLNKATSCHARLCAHQLWMHCCLFTLLAQL